MMNIKSMEKHADMLLKPTLKNQLSQSCSSLIDEFLIIFLVAAKANGVSSFQI